MKWFVQKKTKSGMQDQDIVSMIRSVAVTEAGEKCIELEALVCCQNPTLNPAQILLAIDMYLPQYKPDHATVSRLEIYDSNETIFR